MLQTDDYERGYAAGKDKMLSEILQRAEDPVRWTQLVGQNQCGVR